jgi:dihydropteroate synthase
VSGAAAIALCETGAALALAGGPFAFTHARITGGAAPDELAGAPVRVADLVRWAEGAARAGDDAPAALISRVSRPRADVAGLAVSGAGGRPRILGVCNVTPDSFSDGGDHAVPEQAVAFGRALFAAGADIVDVGGESTRPGADPVDPDTELVRVLPVVEGLVAHGIPVSIDTRRARVMRAAIEAGAVLVNDVSALSDDPDAITVVAETDVPVIVMHMQGQPRDMQDDPRYANVVEDVHDVLAARVDACVAAGIAPERVIVDPGFGFGKTEAHNYELLAGLAQFHGLG